MPTPTDIIKTAIICVKRDVLPPIVAELKAENAELRERLRKLEELVFAFTMANQASKKND
jgi:hypothetical protein